MMSDKPRMVFVDLWGKEITPPVYKQPDMTGIALPDANGQLRVPVQHNPEIISEMEAALW